MALILSLNVCNGKAITKSVVHPTGLVLYVADNALAVLYFRP